MKGAPPTRLFILILIVLLSSPELLRADPAEPEARGHTLSYWLEHYMTRATDAQRKEAEQAEIAIREIGTNALPALIAWLRYEPSQTKTNIQAFLARLRQKSYGRWVPPSLTYDHGVPPANIGFLVLGQSAAEAVPELSQIANDVAHPRPAARAMMALSAIGPKALPAVEARLANTNFPFPPEAAVNMYLRTRTYTNYNRLGSVELRPILLELQTNANPLLVQGASNLLQRTALPSFWERGKTKSVSEAMSDIRTERQMGTQLKPGWNIHPRDKLSPEEQLAASNAVHTAMTSSPPAPANDEPYPYPLRPGTAAWNYAEAFERVQSVEIPKSWREQATSWQLFRSAIANPYFRVMHVGGDDIARSYAAARSGPPLSILSEVDTSPDFGTNVLRWLIGLDLARLINSHCDNAIEPCFMDYGNVCYMATLDSALQTMDIASRQKLFRLAIWDADFFLSQGDTMIAAGPTRIVYTLFKKPEDFRGPLPHNLILPSVDAQPLGLPQGFSPNADQLRPAIAKAKELLGIKQRP